MAERRTSTVARRRGIAADLGHWWQGQRDDWNTGERHLAYTLIACSVILLVGLIVVPMSIPEPLPGPDRSQQLGERYLRALPASAKDRPTLAEVDATYGADGGEACTAKLADAYDLLLTKRPGGGKSFNRAAFSKMRIVHRVYCPERTKQFNAYVKQRSAAQARARARALEAQTPVY